MVKSRENEIFLGDINIDRLSGGLRRPLLADCQSSKGLDTVGGCCKWDVWMCVYIQHLKHEVKVSANAQPPEDLAL
eukprot:1385656-Amorphochlora_amoeboformis.AAC.1